MYSQRLRPLAESQRLWCEWTAQCPPPRRRAAAVSGGECGGGGRLACLHVAAGFVVPSGRRGERGAVSRRVCACAYLCANSGSRPHLCYCDGVSGRDRRRARHTNPWHATELTTSSFRGAKRNLKIAFATTRFSQSWTYG
eukprot:5246422-Prymnesium_polylepis.1